MTEIDDLKKLRPGDRIQKLKELEEEKKKEILEAEQLIEDSIAEIKEERIREEVEIPIADITAHLQPEEEQNSLESVAAREVPEALEEAMDQYASRLEEIKDDIYHNPDKAYELGQEAREQMGKLSEISNNYSLSGNAAEAMNMAANVYKDIKGYKS